LNEEAPTFEVERGRPGAGRPSPAALATTIAGRLPLVVVSVVAALLVLRGFFLPWMEGAGPFGERSFSGFDFARLVRNFELTADTASSTGQVRGTAIALYLIPAAAINGAVLHVIETLSRSHHRAAAWALIAAGAYALLLLAVLLMMSIVPFNDFAGAVGRPSWGFVATLAGALALLWCGKRALHS
jgi:hypothetical protein